ncbi:MAG: MFS transporter [Chloroflexi bacterium]|nr:MFS transporter [Chloroflexota bacterium]
MHWPTVALAFTAMFMLMGSRTAFAVLYPAMVTAEGWSVAEISSAYSSGLLLYAILAIGFGVGVDRLGCRTMMVAGSLLMGIGLLVAASASQLWQLYVAYLMIAGLGAGGIGFITLIKTLSLRTGPRFATAFGIAFMGQGLGSLLVSPAVQLLVDAQGWRLATVLCGLAVLLVLLPMGALLAPGRHESQGRGSSGQTGGNDAPGVLSLVCLIFVIANFTLGFQMLVPTHQVAYMLDLRHAATVAATAAGAWGLMMSVGSLAGGWLVDKLGLTQMLIYSLIVFALGTIGLALSTPEAAWLLGAYVLASGVGRGLFGVTLGAAQTRTFAGPRLGRMTGILDIGFGSGAFLGPWGVAVLHDQVGTFAPGFLATIPASIVCAACTIAAMRLRSAAGARGT